jgi:hypothetical protein
MRIIGKYLHIVPNWNACFLAFTFTSHKSDENFPNALFHAHVIPVYEYKRGDFLSKPTISVYNLVDEEYQVSQFRGSDALRQAASRLRIISSAFPELNITAQQIVDTGS